MGKSDPYLEFSRMMPGGGSQTVLRTEVNRFLGLSVTHWENGAALWISVTGYFNDYEYSFLVLKCF